jgi:hypothetical protein
MHQYTLSDNLKRTDRLEIFRSTREFNIKTYIGQAHSGYCNWAISRPAEQLKGLLLGCPALLVPSHVQATVGYTS